LFLVQKIYWFHNWVLSFTHKFSLSLESTRVRLDRKQSIHKNIICKYSMSSLFILPKKKNRLMMLIGAWAGLWVYCGICEVTFPCERRGAHKRTRKLKSNFIYRCNWQDSWPMEEGWHSGF
jgi:hypothetical protein